MVFFYAIIAQNIFFSDKHEMVDATLAAILGKPISPGFARPGATQRK
jgi:hypothetical protein